MGKFAILRTYKTIRSKHTKKGQKKEKKDFDQKISRSHDRNDIIIGKKTKNCLQGFHSMQFTKRTQQKKVTVRVLFCLWAVLLTRMMRRVSHFGAGIV